MKQNRLRNVFGWHKLADVKRNGACIRECDVFCYSCFQCKNLYGKMESIENLLKAMTTHFIIIVVVFADRMIGWMCKALSCERHYFYSAIWYCDWVRLRPNFNGNLPSEWAMRRCSGTYTMTCSACLSCLHRHTVPCPFWKPKNILFNCIATMR